MNPPGPRCSESRNAEETLRREDQGANAAILDLVDHANGCWQCRRVARQYRLWPPGCRNRVLGYRAICYISEFSLTTTAPPPVGDGVIAMRDLIRQHRDTLGAIVPMELVDHVADDCVACVMDVLSARGVLILYDAQPPPDAGRDQPESPRE